LPDCGAPVVCRQEAARVHAVDEDADNNAPAVGAN
jgi:hypothetical protein